MRMFVIKEPTGLQGVSTQLLRRTAGEGGAGALERLQALNPHVDFRKLAAGTVLLVPDSPAIKPSASRALGDEPADALAKDLSSGLKEQAARAQAAFKAQEDDRSAVAAALKTAAVKRIVESDPLLRDQLKAALQQSGEDRKRAEQSVAQVIEMQGLAVRELARLQKLVAR
jgi:hypothetical protein